MDKKIDSLKVQQDRLFVSIASIVGGVSSPVRVKVLHFLSQGPLSVEVLASKIDQSVANTSMHLRKMLSHKLVSVSPTGKTRIYSLHPSAVVFWENCQNFAQGLDSSLKLDVENVYGEINWYESLETTVRRARKNEIVLLDARPVDEFQEPLVGLNMINIPSSELSKNISKLPKKKPVVVFCRGRLCALSAFVVNELRKKGINAYRLKESWHAIKEVA